MLCFLNIIEEVVREENTAGPGGAFGEIPNSNTQSGETSTYNPGDNRLGYGFPYVYRRNLNFDGTLKRKKHKKHKKRKK